MDLWIRTQNKKVLVQVKGGLYVIKNTICIYKSQPNIGDDIELGVYSSPERALQVLDEIQNSLTTKSVYEMPKE